jgi:1-deoxy-D-xylulose-5-phosphate synthase
MMTAKPLLLNIDSPQDLRRIKSADDLRLLAKEIRHYLIETLSQIEHTHFSANLGVVELTIALHYAFDTPNDALFWDIGHQGYVHKIITGRRKDLVKIRTKGSISGFLSRAESTYDEFGAGHAGTAISAALGAAAAAQLSSSSKHHVAIIGDASIASGMAFEALNHLAEFNDLNLTIVINDNNCSIDESVGGLRKHLNELAQGSSETSMFFTLGIAYSGPIDGHDLKQLLNAFNTSKTQGGINIIHCITQKGKGYAPAEQGVASFWHAPGLFDQASGNSLKPKQNLRYQDVFAQTLIELAGTNQKIVAISAGMLSGTSLNQFKQYFPDRCFDVGIAEQHAVTFAAGLATAGYVPFCVIYSTFLQRAIDQIIHDVALQNLPVVFCVDRAGLVGHDGATHQGVFDISFLRNVPNLIIASPSRIEDLRNLMYTAQQNLKSPLVIRYPRGQVNQKIMNSNFQNIRFGKSRVLRPGKNIMLLGLGTIVNELEQVSDFLKEQHFDAGICDVIFVKPLDEALLHDVFLKFEYVVTLEEHVLMGGFGSAVAEFMVDNNYKNNLLRLGIPDEFVEHASPAEQKAYLKLDAKGISEKILNWLNQLNKS